MRVGADLDSQTLHKTKVNDTRNTNKISGLHYHKLCLKQPEHSTEQKTDYKVTSKQQKQQSACLD